MNTKLPLISVVIPIYNVEKYLKRCLKSVCAQTYSNLEIICINDASTDSCLKILNKFASEDNRISIIDCKVNNGLFAARLEGIKHAKGEYICFVDSDDYVSLDWIRPMYLKAKEKDADIVVSQFLLDDEASGRRLIHSFDPLRMPIDLEGKQVFETFLSQHGSIYSWSVVWNKLYKTELFVNNLENLKKFSADHPRFIMCEDIVYSFSVWKDAKRVTNVTELENTGFYYYLKRANASTNISNDRFKEIERKVIDLLEAFKYAKENLPTEFQNDEKALDYLNKWKVYFAKGYFTACEDSKTQLKTLFNLFEIDGMKDVEECDECDSFYYKSIIGIENEKISSYENIIKKIVDPSIKVVSFDLFDTLVFRPFFFPTDLFVTLSKKFQKLFGLNSVVPFKNMRVDSERRARDKQFKINPAKEEITLDEIYDQMSFDYGLDRSKLDEIKKAEAEKEIQYCYVRKTGKYFFDLAKEKGKTVIVTSDMYLPIEVINAILDRNGFTPDKVYLSSELFVTKYSGHLYEHVVKELGINGKEILHIGDNYDSDYKTAIKTGLNACHLPKAADAYQKHFENMLANIAKPIDMKNPFNGFAGLRCFYALMANKLMDNPFNQINEESDCGGNAYLVGYALMGPYLYSVTDWIIKKAKALKKDTIEYVARDGYLPLHAHKIFEKYFDDLPNKNYLYVSRKSLLLTDIKSKDDLQSLKNKINVYSYSPRKLVKSLLPFLTKDEETLKSEISSCGLDYEQPFGGTDKFDVALKKIAEYVDINAINQRNSELKEYFLSQITMHSVLFDVGYGGRAESSLTKLLGFPLDSLYLHTNSDLANERMDIDGFNIDCFYDYKPKMTGLAREHSLMQLGPSTIGYEKVDGVYRPKFEKYHCPFETMVMTKQLQQGALDFVDDFLRIFSKEECLYYRHQDAAFPYEYYLCAGKYLDRMIFASVCFEDDLGVGKKMNLYDVWNSEMYNSFLINVDINNGSSEYLIQSFKDDMLLEIRDSARKMSKFKRALYFAMFDKKKFLAKLKKNL